MIYRPSSHTRSIKGIDKVLEVKTASGNESCLCEQLALLCLIDPVNADRDGELLLGRILSETISQQCLLSSKNPR